MATNSQNTFPIVAATCPADRECVKNGSDVLALAQDFLSVQGLGGNSGGSFPTQDTVGQQALQLAEGNQLQIASILGQLIVFRAGSAYAQVPAGTTEIPISWTNPLPGSGYLVLLTFLAPSNGTALGAAFVWWIVQGSQSTTGCSIHFDNAPAVTHGVQFNWFIIMQPNATTGTTTISGFAPSTASIAGATLVTLFGVGLLGTSAVTVNGTAVATLTVSSDTQISFTVAAGTTSGLIGVTTGNGTVYSATSLTVTA